jgi:hypothetical protein
VIEVMDEHFEIGTNMRYVDDERREYYSRNYRLMTIR